MGLLQALIHVSDVYFKSVLLGVTAGSWQLSVNVYSYDSMTIYAPDSIMYYSLR